MLNIILILFSCYLSEYNDNKVFNLNDLIFYNPISNLDCNEKNYWTPFNTNTTCFKFLSITNNDTSNSNTIDLILDHDLALEAFEKAKEVLQFYTSNWKNILNIDLISQKRLFEVLKSEQEPNLFKPKINAPYNGHLFTNSKIINNKNIYNVGGYWTKDLFEEDTNFAYALTSDGYNSLVDVNKKLGIRPIIKIEKKYIYNIKLFSNITNLFLESTTNWVMYPAEDKLYDGYYYGNLQGFSVTNNYLIFHSSNDSNPYYGILYLYNGNEYKSLYKKSYGLTGHGNGIAYNNKKNTILVASANYYQNTLEYNIEDLNLVNNFTKGFVGIGYDYDNNLYVGYIDRRVYFLETNTFEEIYSFDLTNFETTQDIEYYNGYVFFVTTNFFAGDFFQKYSFYKEGSNIIYVFNAKFENGKPTKNFGMIEDILYLESLGELEAIEFHNNKVYYGFGRRDVDRNYPYYFCNANLIDLIKFTKLNIKYQ